MENGLKTIVMAHVTYQLMSYPFHDNPIYKSMPVNCTILELFRYPEKKSPIKSLKHLHI